MATEDSIKVDNENLLSVIKNPKVDDHDRPFGELEFQVSQVIERLEAGASLSKEGNNNKEERKLSTSILEPESSSLESILEYIEELIYKNDPNNDNCWPLPSLNDVVKSAVLAHSVAAYASCLERTHLQKVNANINSETTRWLTHIFRFFDYNAYYHYDHLEGLVKVTRMMLHYKYPRYLEDGCLALTSQLPTIYSSVASPLGVVQYLCRQLGLPLACIRPVPVNSVFGSNQTMDTMALQRMLAEDAASEARTPLLVLGEAGTACAGHADAAPRLAQLCAAHGAWLHVRGNCLAALSLVPAPGIAEEAPRIADSVTLPLGTWLGIPGLPVVTLYRLPESQVPADPLRPINAVNATREGTLPLLAGLAGTDHAVRRLPALPLWVALKYAGKQAVVKRIRSAFEACHLVWDIVAKLPSIRILSKRPGGEGGAISVEDLTTKPMNTTLLLDVAVPCVVFQFIPTVPDGSTLGRVPSYYDKLNSWLGQILQRDCEQITIDLCESETYGIVLRYCPLESAPDSWLEEGPPTEAHLSSLAACLDMQLEILLATVAHKQTFVRLVEESPVLKLVEMPGWAGLGGVRYVPMGWEALLTDQAKEELNHLNTALVDTLRATDSAFSLGEGVDGLVCVRFGMVTADTEVEELLGLVISIGREVEEQSKVLDTMTEIVKRGIEAATLDLQRESSEKLWQEGLLRRVPVVGGLVNWLSPAQPAAVRGRCLHLSQGTVESTENIYKYHMQIPAGTVPHGVSKAPPPAEIQTAVGDPVKVPASASHSRTSSQSSAHTKAVATNTAALPPAVVEMNDT